MDAHQNHIIRAILLSNHNIYLDEEMIIPIYHEVFLIISSPEYTTLVICSDVKPVT